MLIHEIKHSARKSLSGHWANTALLTLFSFILQQLVPFQFERTVSGSWLSQATPWYTQPVEFVYSLLLVPFTVGITWLYIDLVRGQEPKISDTFHSYQSFRLTLKLVGTSLLVGIYVLLWSLLLIIPGIYKGFAYAQTFYILKDHPEYSINEAITASRELMWKKKWKYFLLNLSFIGWLILGIITIGIALLWVVPYINASNSVFYNDIANDQGLALEPEDPNTPTALS
ncbi:DUF975 family protein [Sporolactobacillus spathodeae]|uniref:Membrane protein n=1 Tax=Sporolactobacillus spathodeae TaxID=1465502 RepID=A0ABS2Q857_9BACL|nr:DUF975 family protein [Sporolactobacillus spathodeae]MBM7657977.1 putative membrane protein [Sporolactobacillus spathodeae]